MTPSAFIEQTNGKSYDMDNAYGYQCWDYFAYLCQTLGYKIVNCTVTGYVIDLWDQREKNGILKNFSVVSKNNLQKGDVIIWRTSPYGTANSHVAIYEGKSGSKARVLDQYSSKGHVSRETLTLNGVAGCFRPKAWGGSSYIQNGLVKEFQKAMNTDYGWKLAVDGSCGPDMQSKLALMHICPYPAADYDDRPSVTKLVQRELGGLTIDGMNGPKTSAKVKNFQKEQGLDDVNGVIGKDTVMAICRVYG